jgi:hypothetical protein
MKRQLAILFFAASVLAPQAVYSAEPPVDAAEEAETERNFGLLTIDILLGGGISSELYLHGEPSVDIGVVPIGKSAAIAVGGGVDIGWCALCGLITALSDLNWSGSYYAPFGRATFHLGSLGGLIPANFEQKYTLDTYLGVLAGPSFYTFKLSDNAGSAVTVDRTAIRVAPLLGARLGLAKNRLLLFGEYRWGVEAGFTTVEFTNPDGTDTIVPQEDINRRGNDFVVGIGVRI